MMQTRLDPTVPTCPGTVRGAVVDGVNIFRGIPYAAPPFGPNRLRPPVAAMPWSGVRDALVDGASPPQLSAAGTDAGPYIPAGSGPGEDCLNLNIWTPDLGAARLPVLIWITGGAFEVGSAAWYDGSRFARDGVVCVAINYRVGAEGFLHLRDAVPNRGLLDQIAAIDWVHTNIVAFGGDPDRITLCGESAGAMSIGTILAVPAAADRFRRAILESGASHHVLPADDAVAIGERLAAKVGVSPTLGAMADVPPERMLAAQAELKAELVASPDPTQWGAEAVASLMPFHPVVDGEILPAPPIDRIRNGASGGVDVLVGTNIDDWKLFLVASGDLARTTDDRLTGAVAVYGPSSGLAYGLDGSAIASYREARPAASPGELLGAIETDWWCRIPAVRLADAHAPQAARTYMYEFAWPSPVADGLFGACHALEIPFVFDTLQLREQQMLGNLLGADPPQQLATTMHRAWTDFAARGEPGWPAYELANRATMRFDATSSVVEDPRAWERTLWAGIR